MERKASWNFQSTKKKAMIFMIDALVGIVLAVIILTFANLYVTRATRDALPSVQLERVSGDIVRMLEYDGTLSSGDVDTIQSRLLEILPQEINMTLQIEYLSSPVLDLNIPIPSRELVVSGRQFIIISDGDDVTDYAVVRYWAWPR